MKYSKLFTAFAATLIAAYIIYPVRTFAQDETREKNYKIKIIKEENGEKTVVDTTFSSHEDMNAYLKSEGVNCLHSGDHAMTFDFDSDIDEKMKKVHIEMKKVNEEMKEAMKELEWSQEKHGMSEKEIKKLKKELEKLHDMDLDIEIEEIEDGEGHKKIEIIMGDDNTQGRKIFIHDDGENTAEVITGSDADHKVIVLSDEEGDELTEKVIIVKTMDGETEGEPVIRKKKVRVNDQADPATELAGTISSGSTAAVKQTEDTPENNPVSPDSYRIKDEDFRAYPNPTSGILTLNYNPVSNDPVQVKLLDFRGRELINKQIPASQGSRLVQEFDMSDYKKGTYLLQMRQGDYWKHEKIVLK